MAANEIGVIRRSRGAFRKPGYFGGLLFCASLCFSSGVYGQGKREPALPEGNGKQLVTFACSQCHGLRETAILRDGQNGWKETVDRMVLYGAQLSPSEADVVTRYLATQLGPGTDLGQSGTTPPAQRARTNAPQGALAGGTKDISLPEGAGKDLVATHCALCHSLEKVVSTTRSNADWDSTTNNMVQRGMKATPDEIQKMIFYLEANFGSSGPGSAGGSSK